MCVHNMLVCVHSSPSIKAPLIWLLHSASRIGRGSLDLKFENLFENLNIQSNLEIEVFISVLRSLDLYQKRLQV